MGDQKRQNAYHTEDFLDATKLQGSDEDPKAVFAWWVSETLSLAEPEDLD